VRGGRAQSDSVGVILLTGVIVVIAGIGGAAIIGGVAEDAERSSAPMVDFPVEITADNLSVTHAGGDTVTQSELTVIARDGSATERYDVDSANLTGDSDGQFEPSERFERNHSLGGSKVTVQVVHGSSNSVLTRETTAVG